MTQLLGYKRADGHYGIRNTVLVMSLIQCANSAVKKIAAKCDVAPITIETGCGEYHDAEYRTNLGLIRAGQHPNVYGVLLVSLGCQWTDPEYIKKEIEKTGTKVEHLCIQDENGFANTVEKGCEIVNRMLKEGSELKREPFPMSELVLSVYAGGSDWSSSLASNTVTGEAADLFADEGASFCCAPIRGMSGAENHLIDLAETPEVGNQLLDIINEYRQDVFEMTGQSIADVNPTPGNKAHGITTLCEKAIGNLELSGTRTTVKGVLQVGEDCPRSGGQYLCDNRTGANDVYALTTLAMAGAHVCLFTTGRGTPLGNASCVTVKITGNSDTYARLGKEMIDFDASPVITQGREITEMGKELYDKVVEVINGELTKAEIIGDVSWTTPPCAKL